MQHTEPPHLRDISQLSDSSRVFATLNGNWLPIGDKDLLHGCRRKKEDEHRPQDQDNRIREVSVCVFLVVFLVLWFGSRRAAGQRSFDNRDDAAACVEETLVEIPTSHEFPQVNYNYAGRSVSHERKYSLFLV